MLLTNRFLDYFTVTPNDSKALITFFEGTKPMLDVRIFSEKIYFPINGQVGTILQKLADNRQWRIIEATNNVYNGRVTSRKVVVKDMNSPRTLLLKWRGEESLKDFLKAVLFAFDIDAEQDIRAMLRNLP